MIKKLFSFVSVVETRNAANLEAGAREADLPSYTIASGLPTYEEALEQLKKVKDTMCPKPETNECRRQDQASEAPGGNGSALSVFNLFGGYNSSGESGSSKPA